MIITNNWLVAENAAEKVITNPTNNSRPEIDPDYLIIHYTAGDTADSAINWFKNTDSNPDKIAAHIVIDLDGTITQLVSFKNRANHAGSSTWNGTDNMNFHSIGIELVNAGSVEKLSNGSFRRVVTTNANNQPIYKTYPASIASKLVQVKHKNKFSGGTDAAYWFKYPAAQMTALYALSKLLFQQYYLIQALGHDDISPVRKTDPGPAFNWNDFKQNVFGATNNVGKIFIV
ncbi:MAG: N-acetylmuramoyl-L-alanine amidase, partial [Chitinophagaceae bacterium]|nr:N-acetylmuramoyl-L-alanine amidase [Chitinophagaceae bacterium]